MNKVVPFGAGRSVRLKAYIVTYVDHVTDEHGQVTEVHVEYHPNGKSGSDTSGIKGKHCIGWNAAMHKMQRFACMNVCSSTKARTGIRIGISWSS